MSPPRPPSGPPRPDDREDVDGWFRREHPGVYRLCFGFLADAAEAEDVAQDAMLHLLESRDAWDRDRPWAAWRDTVVLNLCRDRLRRRAARARAEDAAAAASREGHGEALRELDTLPARLPDPVRAAQRAEVRRVLEQALAHLSPREREAFVLRDLEGHDTAETARRLGIEAGSVRSLLTLARRRLRNLLGARVEDLVGEGGLG